jgi:hypothetical protein
MIKIKYLLVALCFMPCLFAQNTNENTAITVKNEQYIIQTNTDFYLSGENILYKITNLLPNNSLSKIAYVELINSKNISVFKHKLLVSDGIANNDFFIPTDIETDQYKIITYTNLMLNNNDISSKDIFILNPYLPFPEKFKIKDKDLKPLSSPTLLSASSDLKTNKKEFTKREKASITVDKNLSGNFVLSVTKVDSIPNQVVTYQNLFKTETNTSSSSTKEYPEHRGEVIAGKLVAKNNTTAVANKKIALSFPGEHFEFKVATTDKNGNFKFILESLSGEEAYFQTLENNKEEYSIVFPESHRFNFNFPSENPKINSNYGSAILKRSIANQIQNIYNHTKNDTVVGYKKIKPFYYSADKEYILKDYNPQNSIHEVIIEYINEIYVTKIDGKQKIKVYDYEINFSNQYNNTIVLVNGFLIQDFEEILSYDPDEFIKVSVVNKGYFLNNHIFNGVVNFTTKDLNYLPTISEYVTKKIIDRPQLKKRYYTVDYSKNTFEKIPDYRYQLCWEPNITEISNQKPFEFYTSDVPGNYKIIIEGVTKSGESISIENYIIVK